MNVKLKEFLLELNALLKKYDVEIEALEEFCGYSAYCDGIEFTINGKWDKEGNCIQEWGSAKFGRYIDPKSFGDEILACEKLGG